MKDDMDNDPWIHNNINISRLFKVYQDTVVDIISKHKTIHVESYIHELAALTHIRILYKDQHSLVAQKVFSLYLLQGLSSPDLHAINVNLDFSVEKFIAINTIITNLTLKTTRNEAFVDLTTLTEGMEYGQKRIIFGISSWMQGLPITPINNFKEIGESELCIGFGEAKVQQEVALCLDTLRLAIFTKNAIDVNELDAAIEFKIHGLNITFYLHRLTAKGIYTFTEIAHFRLAESLQDLASFVTLVNIKKMLGINEVFWRLCKKSLSPDMIKSRYKATEIDLDNMVDTAHDGARRCVLRYGN